MGSLAGALICIGLYVPSQDSNSLEKNRIVVYYTCWVTVYKTAQNGGKDISQSETEGRIYGGLARTQMHTHCCSLESVQNGKENFDLHYTYLIFI